MVRALTSHQCGPGSNPGVHGICGLSLLLVLSLSSRGFSPGTPVFPSPQKPTLPNSNSIWNARTRLNEFIWPSMCFVGKQAFFFIFTLLRIGSVILQGQNSTFFIKHRTGCWNWTCSSYFVLIFYLLADQEKCFLMSFTQIKGQNLRRMALIWIASLYIRPKT